MIAQKATILCLYEVLKKYSDENHLLSTEKIRETDDGRRKAVLI